jgi:flagellar protein FliS
MDAREHYLTTQVMTAPPQKLQLMLIEGAIRFGRQTAELWRENRAEEALESLIRCRRIVTEIIGSVKPDAGELARNVRSIYAYLFRLLTEAHWERNEKKLDEAIRILSIERDTWGQVCEKLGTAAESAATPANSAARDGNLAELPVEGLSLNA